jgi:hypothetical protein
MQLTQTAILAPSPRASTTPSSVPLHELLRCRKQWSKIETLEGMVAVNNITIDEQQHQLSTLAARLTALESA